MHLFVKAHECRHNRQARHGITGSRNIQPKIEREQRSQYLEGHKDPMACANSGKRNAHRGPHRWHIDRLPHARADCQHEECQTRSKPQSTLGQIDPPPIFRTAKSSTFTSRSKLGVALSFRRCPDYLDRTGSSALAPVVLRTSRVGHYRKLKSTAK